MTKRCVITEVRLHSDGDDIQFVTSARTVILALGVANGKSENRRDAETGISNPSPRRKSVVT